MSEDEIYKNTQEYGRVQFVRKIYNLQQKLSKKTKILDELKEWLKQEIAKLEEYGASFGLTIDAEISEYITDKISGYKNSLLKLEELERSDNDESI